MKKDTKTKKGAPPREPAGRFAYDGLERIIHEKARLAILTSLATRPDGLLFTELKELCALSDGNLSRHVQALEEAGLVEVWKGFRKRRPQTLCRLSKQGRQRFLAYIEELERVVRDAAAVREPAARRSVPEGWAPAEG